MNQPTVIFDLGTLLSVTTGTLFTKIGNVYEILNYMTGDTLFTHQLPRVMHEMTPVILEQYPQLKDVDVSNVDETNWNGFLHEQISRFGNEFPIVPCGLWQHKVIDPQQEMTDLLDGDESRLMIWNIGE